MTKLIVFLFTTIPALFSVFFASYARKHVTVVAGLIAFSALLLAFIASISAILQSVLALIVIPAWLITPIGIFIPSNFVVVLSAVVSARICRAAFDYGNKKTDLVVKAN